MRILVTGGAGFIGSHVVRGLEKRGHQVAALDDLSGCASWDNLDDTASKQIRADCADLTQMGNVMRLHGPFDVVVHAAANAREGASQFQPYSICYRNLLGMSAVVSSALQAGVRRFVVFSSMSVYGDQSPPFSEDMPLRPVDVYGINKAAMEQTLHVLCEVHGASYVILRPHNVFGEGQALHDKHRNVVGIFMNKIMRGEPLTVYGDGEQTRAFSYIGDSLPCFLRVVEDVGPGLANLDRIAVNVGGRTHITINQMLRAVVREMGVAEDYPVVYHEDRPREVKHAYSTYALSERLLQYEERNGWEQGVRAMAAWARARGPSTWFNSERMEITGDLLPVPWRT